MNSSSPDFPSQEMRIGTWINYFCIPMISKKDAKDDIVIHKTIPHIFTTSAAKIPHILPQ